MNNELIPQKSWWQSNWKWFVPVFIVVIISIGFLSAITKGNSTDIVQAYSETSLYENAIAKAKTNQRVVKVLGEIEPIDKLAILEGNAIYSNNNNTVTTSIRIKGSNGKAKLDIIANKNGNDWIYKKITIRINNPKEEIQVLSGSIALKDNENTNDHKTIENPSAITKDYVTFWTYWQKNVKLSDEFFAVDSNSKTLKKRTVLQLLSTGNYLPVLMPSKKQITYKLHNIANLNDESIKSTIIQMANLEIEHNKREGEKFKDFNFTDVNGTVYNNKNTKGKIVVFKFWIIDCDLCVEEIPLQNKLVNQYKKRNDVLFISVSLDKNEELKKFLSNKEFNYIIVGNQEEFIINELKIEIFPTHIIVDKEGKIAKLVSTYSELETALRKEIKK